MADGGNVIFKFKGDSTDLEKSTSKAESAIGTLAKSFTIANIASSALTKGIQLITQNLDSAISRFDTMNNFPRIMKNLGFAGEDAEKAISELEEGLYGLPTALDEGVLSVQRLASANGDLKKSTKIYLAMNNAILAGGASATVQASAMEQLTQAYSKGKPDAMEWRSIMQAMPAQLKQVAKQLGYTSTAIGGDLQTALVNGTLSMDDFMDAMIKLNENGIDGMASLEEQARDATNGVGTAVRNLKNRVVKSIADVITNIDKSLVSVGGISGAIGKLTKVIQNIIKFVGNAISMLIKFKGAIIAIGTAFALWKAGYTISTKLTSLISKLTLAYKVATGQVVLMGSATTKLTAGQKAYGLIVGVITGKISLATAAQTAWNAVMNANPVGVALIGITALTVGVVALAKATGGATEDERRFNQELENLKNKSKEARDELRQMTDTRKENTDGIQSQFNYTQLLANELKTLADASGRVKEEDKARTQFILNELNKALGTEYTMTGNVINQYSKLSGEIDKLIEKKQAELLLQAYEEDYVALIKKRKDYTERLDKAYDLLSESQEKLAKNGTSANRTLVKNTQKTVDDLLKEGRELYGGIEQIETAMVAMNEGNFAKVNETLEKQPAEYGKMFYKINEESKKGHYTIGETTQKTVKELMNKTGILYKEAGSGYIKNEAEGMKSQQGYLNNTSYQLGQGAGGYAKNGLLSTQSSTKSAFNTYGQQIMAGLRDGMASGKGWVTSLTSSIAQQIKTNFATIQKINSPSRVFMEYGQYIDEGLVIGLQKGEKSIYSTMDKIASNMAFDTNELFSLSPTLNNTATSSSNVTVQVFNNMETDMMGNFINNIKTYSNGSKNDFNYGMA